MLISVTVTTYNRRKLSEHTIDSLYRSTDKSDYELIVVDNASDDGTREMLLEMRDSGIVDKLVLNNRNRHLGHAINQGWAISSEEAAWLMHSSNDAHFMAGWLDNFKRVIEDLAKPKTYFWCELNAGRFLLETLPKKSPSGGNYLLPKKNGIIASHGMTMRRSEWKDFAIKFDEHPFGTKVMGPFSLMVIQLQKFGFGFVELNKPCVLTADCGFNDPEFKEYYEKTYGMRGYLNRLVRKKRTGGHFLLSKSANAARYYKGADYTYLGIHYD